MFTRSRVVLINTYALVKSFYLQKRIMPIPPFFSYAIHLVSQVLQNESIFFLSKRWWKITFVQWVGYEYEIHLLSLNSVTTIRRILRWANGNVGRGRGRKNARISRELSFSHNIKNIERKLTRFRL